MKRTKRDFVCLPGDCDTTLLEGEELAVIAHAVDTLAAAFATDHGGPDTGSATENMERIADAAERSATALETIAAAMSSKGGK